MNIAEKASGIVSIIDVLCDLLTGASLSEDAYLELRGIAVDLGYDPVKVFDDKLVPESFQFFCAEFAAINMDELKAEAGADNGKSDSETE